MSSAVLDARVSRSSVSPRRAGSMVSGSVRASSVPAGQPRLHITARGRAVLMFLVASPLVVGCAFLALGGGGALATSGGSSVPLESVTVFSGQSLWQIAEDLAPRSDPREFIADVVALNGLPSAELRAGQQLDIPAEYTR